MLRSDLHVHTIMSGHGFCTFNECIEDAAKKGILVVGITDHGPTMERAAHEGYFEMSGRLPKKMQNVVVLFGCEANIINKNGALDLKKRTIEALDIVIAGLHEKTSYPCHSESDNTTALIKAMQNNKIHIISHPYRDNFPINIKDVVDASVSEHVLLEINKSLVMKACIDKNNPKSKIIIDKTAEMINCLQNMNTPYIINSDAHHTKEIGISGDEFVLMKEYLGINDRFVLNNEIDQLSNYISSIYI